MLLTLTRPRPSLGHARAARLVLTCKSHQEQLPLKVPWDPGEEDERSRGSGCCECLCVFAKAAWKTGHSGASPLKGPCTFLRPGTAGPPKPTLSAPGWATPRGPERRSAHTHPSPTSPPSNPGRSHLGVGGGRPEATCPSGAEDKGVLTATPSCRAQHRTSRRAASERVPHSTLGWGTAQRHPKARAPGRGRAGARTFPPAGPVRTFSLLCAQRVSQSSRPAELRRCTARQTPTAAGPTPPLGPLPRTAPRPPGSPGQAGARGAALRHPHGHRATPARAKLARRGGQPEAAVGAWRSGANPQRKGAQRNPPASLTFSRSSQPAGRSLAPPRTRSSGRGGAQGAESAPAGKRQN